MAAASRRGVHNDGAGGAGPPLPQRQHPSGVDDSGYAAVTPRRPPSSVQARLVLKPLSDCKDLPLLNRRVSRGKHDCVGRLSGGGGYPMLPSPSNETSGGVVGGPAGGAGGVGIKPAVSLSGATCSRCNRGFGKDEEIVNSGGEVWHTECFVCAQCFQPFPEGVFYEFESRKYCEHDFNVLFAPSCGKCREFITGRVIKAMNASWHPDCFRCEVCEAPLADAGFIKNAGRALCRECNAKEKALGMGKYVCHKCHVIIDEGHIKYKGEAYHPYHFNCTTCGAELNVDAREKGGELYCLRCHDKMGIPICGACRRPIEERVIHALGKTWHVEHFVCAKCEKPFLGTRHYEKKGLAYCETHYHQLFGNICFVCNSVVVGDVFTALNKSWCVGHFACFVCDRKLTQKTKFFEMDLKPVCKTCYEKFPTELKKRLKKAYDQPVKK
jgi:hypothetical protein